MKNFTKLLVLILALVMVFAAVTGCKKQPTPQETTGPTEGDTDVKAEYTYRDYTVQLGTNWNPHTWQTDYDRTMLQYLETPLVAMSVKDSDKGEYQWVYKAATSITDVTKDHKDDLSKYKVTLPAGQTADETEKGYVFEIKLNPEMKWQDGTAINADTYIYSMQALLDPAMQNYRANLYYTGDSAVAGGYTYYHALTKDMYTETPYNEVPVGEKVYMDAWTLWNTAGYKDVAGNVCPQYIAIDDATFYTNADSSVLISGRMQWAQYSEMFIANQQPVYVFKTNENYNENYADTFDTTVGCYKADEYTIRYVTQTATDINYFMNACTSNWLVYKDLYEKGISTKGSLKTANYATGLENTMSYGPYKLVSLQADKQAIFQQNENYYQYQKQEDGTLYAETDYDVDGEKVQAYQTTKIIIDVMTDDAAKQAFMNGDLSIWTPSADDMADYAMSDRLCQADGTDTYSLFFNSDAKALQKMDISQGNQNSVVLSNQNFRKAFSLAIDRIDWISATAGYRPAYTLLNDTYYYDVFNDSDSTYRSTAQAKQSMCDLYGVSWGDGGTYSTLDAAYLSISGYNLTQAKSLMKTACDELVRAGLYKAGQEIKIRVAYSDVALTTANQNQITKLNQYLNAAMEDSGFGKIMLEALGEIQDRHDKIAKGEFAIGYGPGGGAAFYPFRSMQAFCDPKKNSIHERGCWNPATENLTIEVEGKKVTKTWQDWSNVLVGTGEYANATLDVKLNVISTMEREFLAKYYRIPMASSGTVFLQSYQVQNYAQDYNILYGFGGMELMRYNYSDAQWAEYVAKEGGTLRYK